MSNLSTYINTQSILDGYKLYDTSSNLQMSETNDISEQKLLTFEEFCASCTNWGDICRDIDSMAGTSRIYLSPMKFLNIFIKNPREARILCEDYIENVTAEPTIDPYLTKEKPDSGYIYSVAKHSIVKTQDKEEPIVELCGLIFIGTAAFNNLGNKNPAFFTYYLAPSYINDLNIKENISESLHTILLDKKDSISALVCPEHSTAADILCDVSENHRIVHVRTDYICDFGSYPCLYKKAGQCMVVSLSEDDIF